MLLYCTKCGTHNPDDSSYCSKCGNAIRSATAQPSGPVTAQAPSTIKPKSNTAQGCVGVGCLAIVVLVIAVTCSAQNSHISTNPQPKMTESHTRIKHGYFIHARLGNAYVDFYDTLDVYCTTVDRGAQEVADAISQGREVNPDIAESVSGYHKLPNGTHVLVTGHESTSCGTDTSVSFTDIKVQDETSQLNGSTGVIVEGALIEQ